MPIATQRGQFNTDPVFASPLRDDRIFLTDAAWNEGLDGPMTTTASPNITPETARFAQWVQNTSTASGNLLTGGMNLTNMAVSALGGRDVRTVSIDRRRYEDLIMPQDVVNKDSFFGALAQGQIASRTSDLAHWEKYLDEGFDAASFAEKWAENHPDVVRAVNQEGFDIVNILKNAPNEVIFQSTRKDLILQAQAKQRLEQFEAGGVGFVLKGVARDFLINDPSFALGFLTPVGFGHIAAGGTRVGQGVRGALTAVRVPAHVSRGIGSGIESALKAPAALHHAAANRAGYALAIGSELAGVGAMHDLALQMENYPRLNHMYAGTENELGFSWGQFFLSAGLTGSLGYGLGGLSQGFRSPAAQAAAREALAGTASGTTKRVTVTRGYRPTTAAIDEAADAQLVAIQRKLDELSPPGHRDDGDWGWVFDEELVKETGVSLHLLEDMLDTLLESRVAGRVHPDQMQAALGDLFEQAKTYNRSNGHAAPLEGADAIRHRHVTQEIQEDLARRGIDAPDDPRYKPGTREYNRLVLSMTKDRLAEIEADRIVKQIESSQAEATFDSWSIPRGKSGQAPVEAVENQRGLSLNRERVEFYKNNEEARRSGPIEVRRHSDGRLEATDGNHRLAAMKELGETDATIVIRRSDPRSDGKKVTLTSKSDVGKTPLNQVPAPKNPTPLPNGVARRSVSSLQEEYRELSSALRRSDLTLDEEARLLALDTALSERGLLPDMSDILSQPITVRGRVRADGSLEPVKAADEFDLSKFKPTTESGKMVKRLAKLRSEVAEINAKIRALRGSSRDTELDGLKQGRSNLYSKISRLSKKLEEGPPAAPLRTRDEVLKDVASGTMGPEQRTLAAAALFEEFGPAASSMVTSIHLTGKVMKALGMGGFMANFITQRSGQFLTSRSAFAAIRQGADFLSNSRFKLEAMGANGPVWVGNLMGAKREMVRRYQNPITQEIQKLYDTGRLKNHSDQKEFFRVASRVAHGLEKTDDADVNRVVALWRKAADELHAEGVANGRLSPKSKAENFFPFRVIPGIVRKNRAGFAEGITRRWVAEWNESENIHMDTLVELGLARRVFEGSGNARRFAGWEGDGEYAVFGPDLPTKRSQMRPDIAERYTRALTEPVEGQQFTALRKSANRATDNLLDQRTFDQGKDGVLRVHNPGRAMSEFERALDPKIMDDPGMAEYFDYNFADVIEDYLRTTGFQIRAQSKVQQLTGIKGMTVNEYWDAVEIAAMKIARSGTDDAEIIRKGINQLRSKWHAMEGKTPRMMSDSENILETTFELARSGTLAMYGGGIGTMIAMTEAMVSVFSRVYNLRDFFSNMGKLFQYLASPHGTARETLRSLSAAQQLVRGSSVDRFTSGAMTTGFAPTFRERAFGGWRPFWDAVTGKTESGGRIANNKANTANLGIRAFGQSMLVLGGGDYFSNLSRVMHVHSLTRETAQHLKAARKLAGLLNANAEELDAIRLAARDNALDAGKTPQQAEQAANTAYFKRWQGLVRQAGFGGQHQIARRFAEHGLLNEELLDAFMDAATRLNAWKGGSNAMMDLDEIMARINELPPAQQASVQRAVNQIQESMEDTMRRRLSEYDILQQPTDPGALTGWGRLRDAMFSFSRAFVDNQILEQAALPQRAGLPMLMGFITGETMGRIARRLLKGETLDDIQADWEENPERFLARTIMNVPFGGQANPVFQGIFESVLGNRSRASVASGAGSSVLDSTLNLGYDALAAPAQAASGESLSLVDGLSRFGNTIVPVLGLIRTQLNDPSMQKGSRDNRLRNRQLWEGIHLQGGHDSPDWESMELAEPPELE